MLLLRLCRTLAFLADRASRLAGGGDMVLIGSDVTLVRACGLSFFCSSVLLAGDAGLFTLDGSPAGALLVPTDSLDSEEEEVSAEEESDRDLSEVDDGSCLLFVLWRPLDGAGVLLRD